MGFAEEFKAIYAAQVSVAQIEAAADLASRALAAGDIAIAIAAKQYETTASRQLGMHRHAVACCGEVVGLWTRVKKDKLELAADTQLRLVWALKYGSAAAMDIPETPLSVVRELIATMFEVLDHFGARHFAAWELEARLAYIEGDVATNKDRVAKLAPYVSVRSHRWQYANCPGCTLMQFAKYLGLDAPIERSRAVVAPIEDPAPFPQDVELAGFPRYADFKLCPQIKRSYPAFMARANARSGKIAEARVHAHIALDRLASATSDEDRLCVHLGALETALAAKNLDDATAQYGHLTAAMMTSVEDPYELLDATEVAWRAATILGRTDDATRHRNDAIALARRVDARLSAPRHERDTLALLVV